MGGGVQVVDRGEAGPAVTVREKDAAIDVLERQVEPLAGGLLAVRQAVGSDLRHIVAALKASSDLERIADLAKNIAKRAVALSQVPHIPTPGIERLARMVQTMIKEIGRAHV